MRTSTAVRGVLALAVAALVAIVSVVSASARTDAVACTLLSSNQLQSTLALSQSTVLRNYDPTTAVSENIDTECGWGVWSGAAPTTTAAMFALARSGHAAEIGIETWAPHKGPNQRAWLSRDYAKLTAELKQGSLAFPWLTSTRLGLSAHTVRTPRLGHASSGFIAAVPGLGKGLSVALGCWWEDKTSKAICVLDEEASFRPVAAHMVQFAKVAVPKFLG